MQYIVPVSQTILCQRIFSASGPEISKRTILRNWRRDLRTV